MAPPPPMGHRPPGPIGAPCGPQQVAVKCRAGPPGGAIDKQKVRWGESSIVFFRDFCYFFNIFCVFVHFFRIFDDLLNLSSKTLDFLILHKSENRKICIFWKLTLFPRSIPMGPNGAPMLKIQGKIRFFASRWPKPKENLGLATFGLLALAQRF